MTKNKLMLSALMLAAICGTSFASNHQANHEAHSIASSNSNDIQYTPSIIKKIDKENGKITLKHEEIKNLEMPSMTMVFKLRIADISVIDTLKVGDNIKASFDKTHEGYIVKEIIKN